MKDHHILPEWVGYDCPSWVILDEISHEMSKGHRTWEEGFHIETDP